MSEPKANVARAARRRSRQERETQAGPAPTKAGVAQ